KPHPRPARARAGPPRLRVSSLRFLMVRRPHAAPRFPPLRTAGGGGDAPGHGRPRRLSRRPPVPPPRPVLGGRPCAACGRPRPEGGRRDPHRALQRSRRGIPPLLVSEEGPESPELVEAASRAQRGARQPQGPAIADSRRSGRDEGGVAGAFAGGAGAASTRCPRSGRGAVLRLLRRQPGLLQLSVDPPAGGAGRPPRGPYPLARAEADGPRLHATGRAGGADGRRPRMGPRNRRPPGLSCPPGVGPPPAAGSPPGSPPAAAS